MDRYPAFYYGLAVISGVALAYGIWPPLIFIFLDKTLSRKIGFLLLVLFSCVETLYFMPTHPNRRLDGIGYYQTEKIRNIDHSFSYQGCVKCFISEGVTYYDIPCSFFRNTLLPPESDYIVRGSLRPTQRGTYTLHASSFEPISHISNCSFIRFQLKETFRNYLKKHVKDDFCYSFFASLGTGEIESRLLGLQFSKVGVTHTLAISGFHYTWLIFILAAFFHLFLSKRKTCYILLVVVSLYFFFIGETPSLNRAWLAAIICLIGYLIKESVNGLNSLGVALIISLILDPFALEQIGFQLSYIATFALLTIFPTVDTWLYPFFPKRTQFRLDYILSSFCRTTLALTVAVNSATIPLLLHHFHYFPLLSFFFNLFFPLAITVPMLALIISPLPWVGSLALTIAEWYTTPLLNMIFYGIDSIEWMIWVGDIPFDLLCALLIGTISLGLWLEQKRYLTRITKEV